MHWPNKDLHTTSNSQSIRDTNCRNGDSRRFSWSAVHINWWGAPMQRVSEDRRIFWRCVPYAPKGDHDCTSTCPTPPRRSIYLFRVSAGGGGRSSVALAVVCLLTAQWVVFPFLICCYASFCKHPLGHRFRDPQIAPTRLSSSLSLALFSRSKPVMHH